MRFIFGLVITASVLIAACTGKGPVEVCLPPPPELLRFQLQDNSNANLLDSTETGFVGNIMTVNTCTQVHGTVSIAADSTGSYAVANDIYYSGTLNGNCQQALLQYSNGDVDTIGFEMERHGNDDCVHYIMQNLSFNGELAEERSSNGLRYFIFRK